MSELSTIIVTAAISTVTSSAVTGLGAMAVFSNKVTKVTERMESLADSCLTCRGNLTQWLSELAKEVHEHHEDGDKHLSTSLEKSITDIQSRVMRIESKLFKNGS